MMTNPSFISGYNVIQEVITFVVVLLHENGADAVVVVLMLFYQMSVETLWNPRMSCTKE